jgi:hypothetical protein
MTDSVEARTGLEPLLGVAELADYLGVPPQRVYDWRLSGTGPRGYRIGRELKFPVSEVRRWLGRPRTPIGTFGAVTVARVGARGQVPGSGVKVGPSVRR